MDDLVPSEARPNGLAAIEDLIDHATSISGAAAFVTESGVELLANALERRNALPVEVVARGGGVTSPEALVKLRDELGVAVSVVIGRHAAAFHPKLWLIRSAARLSVLSGSGNLTRGGLLENDEQFEVLQVDADSEKAIAHEERFDVLTINAVSLDELERAPIWSEWLSVVNAQRAARKELARLEARLARREVVPGRDGDKRRLLADLEVLYDATVAARLRRDDGALYVPSRFKQGINRAREGGDPVLLVTRICRHQTGGFDVILRADRPELTVELLVLDGSKPYHDLFSQTTRRLSDERLRQFPSWRPD